MRKMSSGKTIPTFNKMIWRRMILRIMNPKGNPIKAKKAPVLMILWTLYSGRMSPSQKNNHKRNRKNHKSIYCAIISRHIPLCVGSIQWWTYLRSEESQIPPMSITMINRHMLRIQCSIDITNQYQNHTILVMMSRRKPKLNFIPVSLSQRISDIRQTLN